MINNNTNKYTEQLISILRTNNITIKSCITLNISEEYSSAKGNFPSLFQRLQKKFKFGYYVYCYELGMDNKLFHMHIATSEDFSSNFLQLKKFWMGLLSKESGVSYTYNNILLSSHYQKVDHTWEKMVEYCCKGMFDTVLLKELKLFLGEKARFFGGSSHFQRVFADYRKTLVSFLSDCENKIKSKSNSFEILVGTCGAVPQVDLVYARVLEDYKKEYPDISENLIKAQFLNEINCYSDLFYAFDFGSFTKFLSGCKTSSSRFYVEFRNIIHKLFLRFSVMRVCEDWLGSRLVSLGKSSDVSYKEVLYSLFNWSVSQKKVVMTSDKMFYIVMNCVYVIFKSQDLNKLAILKKLAMVSLRISGSSSDFSDSEAPFLIKLGSFIYFFVKLTFFSSVSEYIQFFESGDGVLEESASESEEGVEDLEELPYAGFKITLFFTDKLTAELEPSFKKLQHEHLNLLSFNLPMVVPPKSWKFVPVFSERRGRKFISAVDNYTGGLLINNILIKRPLCKSKSYFSDHSLQLTSEVVEFVNNLQRTAFCVDTELFEFYIKNKKLLPDYLSAAQRSQCYTNLRELKKTLTELFARRAELKQGSGEGLHSLSQKIRDCLNERQVLSERLTRDRNLRLYLDTFSQVSGFEKLYYYYEFDFRMRIYPNPQAASFMGSRLVRSLIRFFEKCAFIETPFRLYSTLQALSLKVFSEDELGIFFPTKVQNLLETFKVSVLTDKTQWVKVKEPYLFLACAFEWERYNKNKKAYESGFPIYLDCSSNGPQLISLFFALETFATFLNLTAQTAKSSKGDFYITVIEKFLKKNPQLLLNADDTLKLSEKLRSGLKMVIMTQFYGISYYKFMHEIQLAFAKEKEMVSSYFKIDNGVSNFIERFCKLFWEDLRSLPLFKLETLLHEYQKSCDKKTGALEWSVFDKNIITMHYLKSQKKITESHIGGVRARYVWYEALKNQVSRKQRSALMANFVHSLDAYVLFRTCVESRVSVMPIHDSFGVHSSNVDVLRSTLRRVYADLVDNKYAATYFVSQMEELITESSSSEVGRRFVSFVESCVPFGKLSVEDINSSYYYIYYS